MVSRRRFFRVCHWLHRWTGLIAAPFFLILCLTGGILVFRDEIDALVGATPPLAPAVGEAKPLATLAKAAIAARPGMRPISIYLDPDTPDRAYVGIAPPGPAVLRDHAAVPINRTSATPLPYSDPRGTFTGFIFDLHARWFLGVPGELFGGAIAVLVLLCLASGVVVYAPYVRKLLFGTVRRRSGMRLVQLDLHNLIGTVLLGWALVVTVTGICLAAGTLLLSHWQATELRAMAGPASHPVTAPVSIDAAARSAQAAEPGRRLNFLIYPQTDFSGPGHYAFLLYGGHRYDERLFKIVLVDAATGRVTADRPLPMYLKALVLSGPLHFGDYAGWPLKLFWVLCAAGTLFITGNGAVLWWLRHRAARLRAMRV
jgi:uncharacterized iron-regulated membrane protein